MFNFINPSTSNSILRLPELNEASVGKDSEYRKLTINTFTCDFVQLRAA